MSLAAACIVLAAAAAAVAPAGLPGASSKAEEPLYQLMSVAAVVDALPAAHSLAMACMQTFTLLLGCHKELPEPLQLQVLTALAQQQQRQQQSADQASEEVRSSCSHEDGYYDMANLRLNVRQVCIAMVLLILQERLCIAQSCAHQLCW
jgi:hypothetical protein